MKALVVTRGAQGSDIYVDGADLAYSGRGARNVVDPIGCGDAYRGGVLYGIAASAWTGKRPVVSPP